MKTYQIVETNEKDYVIDVKKHFFKWTWWSRIQEVLYYDPYGAHYHTKIFDTIEEVKEYLKEINKPSEFEKTIEIITYD